MRWILFRSALTIVAVEVVLANNLGPNIPAAQYGISVSEGVLVGQEIFTVPVSRKRHVCACVCAWYVCAHVDEGQEEENSEMSKKNEPTTDLQWPGFLTARSFKPRTFLTFRRQIRRRTA